MKQKENRLVVANKGWAESIPEWLLEEVKTERLLYGLGGLTNPDAEKIGDAEACVYLYTLSLTAPISDRMSNVYIYLMANLSKRKELTNLDFMEEKLKQGLTEDEKRELRELKEMIYKSRGGEINHPLLNAMRELKKEIYKK